MIRALIDTNVLLDLFLARPPFATEATLLWNAALGNRFEGWISGITPNNVYYIVRKTSGKKTGLIVVSNILACLRTVAINETILRAALHTPADDYEDAIQVVSALTIGADFIVSRDSKGFAQSPIPVLSPSELLQRLASSTP